tara:strand:- start:29970 stop:30980 length:1011 start_codon:yes stop_codon:yes gene_type:complete
VSRQQLAPGAEILSAFPLFSSDDADEARQKVANVFCPHDLRPVNTDTRFSSRHNLVRLGETALNYLTYGTDVDILPGCLESFYLVQVPVASTAQIRCGNQEVLSSPATASILNPHEPTRMRWKHDNRQLMLWLPRASLERRLTEHLGDEPHEPLSFDIGLSQTEGLTASWCRMLRDLADNVDQCGADWLNFRPTVAAMEDCLIRGLLQLHRHNYSDRLHQPQQAALPRHVQRAIDYIHAHVEDAITVGDMARVACVSVRALEEGFRKHCDSTPLVYLRDTRLDCVRKALLSAAPGSDKVAVLAHRYGFAHLGRFSAYYKNRFGESPSQTAARPRYN